MLCVLFSKTFASGLYWPSYGFVLLKLLVLWRVFWVLLDVFHDFGMGFPSQDLDISGVDCNKMLGAKVAFIIPLGNPCDRGG